MIINSQCGAYLGDRRKHLQVRRAKLRALWVEIKARHAAELSSATFINRCRIEWCMALEYRRESRRILPSPYAL